MSEPGMMPARKRLLMSVRAMMPNRIKGMAGGKSRPRLPEVVTSPRLYFSG